MKFAISYGKYAIYFLKASIVNSLFLALVGYILSFFKQSWEHLLLQDGNLNPATYFLASMFTLDYFYTKNGRKPEAKEYWILVIATASIIITFQNILWKIANTTMDVNDRGRISILIFGTIALGYSDYTFRYRKRKSDQGK